MASPKLRTPQSWQRRSDHGAPYGIAPSRGGLGNHLTAGRSDAGKPPGQAISLAELPAFARSTWADVADQAAQLPPPAS